MEINIRVNPLRMGLQIVVICEPVDFKEYLYSGAWSCQFPHILYPLSSTLDSRKRATISLKQIFFVLVLLGYACLYGRQSSPLCLRG